MSELTVVIPIFNVEKYLPKCIMSVINQTYKSIDMILVDDGSTDNSGRIADDFAEKYENITVIHKPNGGLSDARNTGLDMVNTPYVTFVDSDDYIEPNMYSDLLKVFQNEEVDVSIGSVWYEQENGVKKTPYKIGVVRTWNQKEALIKLLSHNYFNMSFCDKVFRTDLFTRSFAGEDTLRFPVGKKCEDQHIMCKLLARSRKIHYSSEPYYHYIQRPGSISRNSTISIAPIEAAEAQLNFYQVNFPELAYAAESEYLFTCISICAAFKKRSIECPENILQKATSTSKKYLNSVFRFKELSPKKKMQALLFRISKELYFKLLSIM